MVFWDSCVGHTRVVISPPLLWSPKGGISCVFGVSGFMSIGSQDPNILDSICRSRVHSSMGRFAFKLLGLSVNGGS